MKMTTLTYVTDPNLPSTELLNSSILKTLHSSKFEILHESSRTLDRGLVEYSFRVQEKDIGALETLRPGLNQISYLPLSLTGLNMECTYPSSIEVSCEQGISNILLALIPKVVGTALQGIDITKIGFGELASTDGMVKERK